MNNILIQTHDCTREELTELQEYLENKSWDWQNLVKNQGGNLEAIKSSLHDLVTESENIIKSLPQKGDTARDCQRVTLLGATNQLERAINGLEHEDLVKYFLKDGYVAYTKIHEKIFNEELFEYAIVDRDDLIQNLIGWIAECKNSDKEKMMTDLRLLMMLEDKYIFSSFSTNKYVYQGHPEFHQTCEDLLTLNNEIDEEEQR